MLSREQARSLVLNYFNDTTKGELGLVEGDVYDILDQDTIETWRSWIFNCNSRLYFETRNHRYLARGFGPVIVKKRDGRIRVLETDCSLKSMCYISKLPLPSWFRELILNLYIFL